MTTQEFVATITTDNQALIEKLQGCKAPEEVYDIAKGEGLTDGFDTFTAEMTKFYESVKDISDEDMQNVSGGKIDGDALLSATVSASAASAVTAAISVVCALA